MEEIALPKPNLKGLKSLEECIYERESVRKFQEKEVDLEAVSQILWAAQGIKVSNRTVPSAGGMYPLEVFINIKNEGLFHYDFIKHSLNRKINDISDLLVKYSWNQTFIAEARLNIIICADFKRSKHRYGKRAMRYVYIEAGHCAQNILLQCISLGLGCVPIGAFQDSDIKKIMELPEDLDPLYIIPIGFEKWKHI